MRIRFADWKRQVEKILGRTLSAAWETKAALDWYGDGWTPREAAESLVEW